MKPEYHEGPKALENFNDLATKLFRAPKTVVAKKPTKPVRKPKKASKG
jgi:hypothetical protein